MIKYKIVKVTKEDKIAEVVVCDVCKKEFAYNDPKNNEIGEFLHIRFTGGWGSVFGDMGEFEMDICQHCLKEKLGQYIREVSYES